MVKMFSLGDSLKSLQEISVSGSFSFNWPIVGHAGDSECRGFPFLVVLLGDRDLLCTSAGLAEWSRCGRTWEVRLVLPPLGVASWGAWVRARDPVARRVLAWSHSGTSCERFRGRTARGGGYRHLGKVVRAVTTHGVVGDGEGVRVFGREISFWGETHYARISGVIWIAQGEIRDTLAHAQPRAKWRRCSRPTRCGQP
jgi:hypothetical protein